MYLILFTHCLSTHLCLAFVISNGPWYVGAKRTLSFQLLLYMYLTLLVFVNVVACSAKAHRKLLLLEAVTGGLSMEQYVMIIFCIESFSSINHMSVNGEPPFCFFCLLKWSESLLALKTFSVM